MGLYLNQGFKVSLTLSMDDDVSTIVSTSGKPFAGSLVFKDKLLPLILHSRLVVGKLSNLFLFQLWQMNNKH